ncbi:CopD family protein [Bradyrhizobium sp. 31Argb]|uniref:CopD family protein n=1 Tax=unclassified Bradyrhizobium TaxID=2631580 RepID=UPI0013EE7A1F|nr:CopD family protein [Bradyrhizobium sp. Leo170]
MSLAALYPWLKALHVVSAFLFVAGTITTSIVLAAERANPGSVEPVAGFLAKSERWLTTPAMLLVWAFGLTLAVTAGWFSNTWLQVKLAFVVLLSAVHGIQSGQLRRLVRNKALKSWTTLPLILVSMTAVVVLVVVKP